MAKNSIQQNKPDISFINTNNELTNYQYENFYADQRKKTLPVNMSNGVSQPSFEIITAFSNFHKKRISDVI